VPVCASGFVDHVADYFAWAGLLSPRNSTISRQSRTETLWAAVASTGARKKHLLAADVAYQSLLRCVGSVVHAPPLLNPDADFAYAT
jgi:hypothetical protein